MRKLAIAVVVAVAGIAPVGMASPALAHTTKCKVLSHEFVGYESDTAYYRVRARCKGKVTTFIVEGKPGRFVRH